MNCEQAKNLITISVFGNPGPAERSALEEHLCHCPDCARIFEKSAVERRPFDVPDDIPLPDWEKSWDVISVRALNLQSRPRLFGLPGKWVFAAVSLLAVFILGYFAGHQLLRQRFGQPLESSIPAAPTSSPFQEFAESLEPVLVDFMNRGVRERPKEMVDLERNIIRSMLAETRLLQSLADQSRDASLKGFLEEIESLLISMANLNPGDRDSADLLDRMIRDRQIRYKLRELSGVKTLI